MSAGSKKFRPGWADPPDVQRWLDRELFVGETLNFPCGASQIGDVRADVDSEMSPDVVADLYNIPFQEGEFDTVYCDPPFSEYGFRDGYWVPDVWALADKRLILQTPPGRIQIPRCEKQWWICEPNPGSGQTGIQLFQVFDRPGITLEDYR